MSNEELPLHQGARARPSVGQIESKRGWPRLSDLSPLLLRSAGIVGIAGTIMAVVSGGAWIPDPRGSVRSSVVTPVDRWEEPGDAVAEGAALIASDERLPSESEPLSSLQSSASEDLMAGPAPVPSEPVVMEASLPSESPAEPAHLNSPPTDMVAAPMEPERVHAELPASGDDPAAAEPSASDSARGPVERVAVVNTVVTDGDAEALEALLAEPHPAIVEPEIVEPEVVASVPGEPEETASLEVEPAEAPEASPYEIAALEAEPVEECPRDWVTDEGDTQAGTPEDCEPLTAMLTEPPVEDQVALEEAAEQLAAMMPRLPAARPEPPEGPLLAPPVRTRAQAAPARDRSAWPDEPPPNCGDKHAYWRYVGSDKQWYCK